MASLILETIDSSWVTAQFDISVSLAPQDDNKVHGSLSYATALFDGITVLRYMA